MSRFNIQIIKKENPDTQYRQWELMHIYAGTLHGHPIRLQISHQLASSNNSQNNYFLEVYQHIPHKTMAWNNQKIYESQDTHTEHLLINTPISQDIGDYVFAHPTEYTRINTALNIYLDEKTPAIATYRYTLLHHLLRLAWHYGPKNQIAEDIDNELVPTHALEHAWNEWFGPYNISYNPRNHCWEQDHDLYQFDHNNITPFTEEPDIATTTAICSYAMACGIPAMPHVLHRFINDIAPSDPPAIPPIYSNPHTTIWLDIQQQPHHPIDTSKTFDIRVHHIEKIEMLLNDYKLYIMGTIHNHPIACTINYDQANQRILLYINEITILPHLQWNTQHIYTSNITTSININHNRILNQEYLLPHPIQHILNADKNACGDILTDILNHAANANPKNANILQTIVQTYVKDHRFTNMQHNNNEHSLYSNIPNETQIVWKDIHALQAWADLPQLSLNYPHPSDTHTSEWNNQQLRFILQETQSDAISAHQQINHIRAAIQEHIPSLPTTLQHT